ncbi:uncharacterized protein LOC143368468 [Andrena cerasifolii]|uniref:uncharacterized protein LOC143368468 n=1 Tax=Andrena cerasifolii TaxID=2819439 RepID=UPI0040377238
MSFVGAYLRCPFNESHRIIEGRLQKHLFKCRRNYPKNYKVVCPFDASHMLDPYEYEHHLSVCTTSGNMMCYTTSFESEKEVGTIPIEEACSLQTNTLDNEDWFGNTPTYNPLVATANKPIVRTAIGLSKAKKKEFKQRERDRLSALENSQDKNNSKQQSIVYKEPEFASPLRPPKKAAKALSCTGGTDNVSISDLISKLKEVTVKNPDGCSALEKNTSQGKEEEENILKEDTSTSANQHNASNTTGHNVSNVRENLTETAGNESRKVRHLNPRSAATLRGEVKKISTGRGFTIAYQYLKAEVSRNQTLENDSKDFGIIYGYNEDEENCDPQNKLE